MLWEKCGGELGGAIIVGGIYYGLIFRILLCQVFTVCGHGYDYLDRKSTAQSGSVGCFGGLCPVFERRIKISFWPADYSHFQRAFNSIQCTLIIPDFYEMYWNSIAIIHPSQFLQIIK